MYYATHKQCLEALLSEDSLYEYKTGWFAHHGSYVCSHGEYERPDFHPVRYAQGWAIRVRWYFYVGTLHTRQDGPIDITQIADYAIYD